MASLSKITRNGKALYLAYDQGLEHGPTADFNDRNVDPLYVLEIAEKGRLQGIVYQKGIAEKYRKEIKSASVPLIVKLNGRTNLCKGEPISEQVCTVKEAIKLGADAVGFTIYIGSPHEARMFGRFGKIEKEAHEKGIPLIAWIYPNPTWKKTKNNASEITSYAARTGLELGADVVKIKYNGDAKGLKWAVKSAGRTKVVVAGGTKKNEKQFLQDVRDIKKAGALGMAVGRNIWQHKDPLKITKKITEIMRK